ncbi:MAG: methyltransferase domain-containing protein [Candidatus Thermoplasmatota archaeon]
MLNIGCGIAYKPNSVNIDCFDASVADMLHNAIDLPFESNTLELIEAYHILEHFDYIHCKYVLSEWYRILKPNGKLTIETPDIEETFRKFNSLSMNQQKATLQWLYGIDSMGMQHRTGFTYKILEALLLEIGFEEATRKEQKMHKYKPGLRVECRKPENRNMIKEMFCIFRKEVRKKLPIEDSDTLLNLEEHCIKRIANGLEHGSSEANVKDAIACTALHNPAISLILYEKCIEFRYIKENKIIHDLVEHLCFINFHKKLLSLWARHSKRIGDVDRAFAEFLIYIEALIIKLMDHKTDYKQRLRYIATLPEEDIEIFSYHTVQMRARVLLNKGIKKFHKKEWNEALELFSESSRLYPENPLVHWNLARLCTVVGTEKKIIRQHYNNALSAIGRREELKKAVEEELNYFKKFGTTPTEPVSEYDIV